MSLSPKKVKDVRARDGFRCAAEGERCTVFRELTTQHRANRGIGGSKLRDEYSNLVTLCLSCNVLLEQDAAWAEIGRERGWKLASWENPTRVAVWFAWAGEWRVLDDEGGWVPARGRHPLEVLEPEVRAVLAGGDWNVDD